MCLYFGLMFDYVYKQLVLLLSVVVHYDWFKIYLCSISAGSIICLLFMFFAPFPTCVVGTDL